MTKNKNLKGAWYYTTAKRWVFTNNPNNLKGKILKGPCLKPE